MQIETPKVRWLRPPLRGMKEHHDCSARRDRLFLGFCHRQAAAVMFEVLMPGAKCLGQHARS
ncbi:MAG: hypothetical protein C0458_16575 [Methylobacterium sp.]|nr:hypothetical protein [Methylobacterium sp.]